MNDSFDSVETTACIVGGGPAGAVLAYMLARKSIDVTLLESHQDFDRDFRGDTLHPSIMEVMDELGLAGRLLQLPHTELADVTIETTRGRVQVATLRHLHTKFPYITFMPQARFLDFVIGEARRFPSFHLHMGARVEELIEDGDVVQGVRYRSQDGWHMVRALLTVGADGRFSRLRKLSGLGENVNAVSAPMDVLWFRLPRAPSDPEGVMARFGHGHLLILLNRGEQWQVAMVIAKDTYPQLHARGIQSVREAIASTAPELKDRLDALRDWGDTSLLSVAADRLLRWYKPGLLLIGDAAHVMSPVGGNGINYAVMDAVAAANILVAPLQKKQLYVDDLARVQRARQRPTQIIQSIVNFIQDNLLTRVLDPEKSLEIPGVARWQPFGAVAARVVAFGIKPEHVRN